MFRHHWIHMRREPLENRAIFRKWLISHGDHDIPKESAVPRPRHRRPREPGVEFCLAKPPQFGQIRRERTKRRMEFRIRRIRRVPVPRADLLADVASKDMVAVPTSRDGFDRAPQLNSLMGDTQTGIERPAAACGRD